MARADHEREIVETFLANRDHYPNAPPRGTVRVIVDGVIVHEGQEALLSWAKRTRFTQEDRAEAMRLLGNETELEAGLRADRMATVGVSHVYATLLGRLSRY